MVNVWAAEMPAVEVPAVEPGFVTVIVAVPTEASLSAGTVAIIWFALTQEEESDEPFQFTVAPFSKLEPESTGVRSEAPAGALEGAMELRTGMS
jgi:hypothetical protein